MKNTKTRMDLSGFTADGELSGQISGESKKRTHDKLCGRHVDNRDSGPRTTVDNTSEVRK